MQSKTLFLRLKPVSFLQVARLRSAAVWSRTVWCPGRRLWRSGGNPPASCSFVLHFLLENSAAPSVTCRLAEKGLALAGSEGGVSMSHRSRHPHEPSGCPFFQHTLLIHANNSGGVKLFRSHRGRALWGVLLLHCRVCVVHSGKPGQPLTCEAFIDPEEKGKKQHICLQNYISNNKRMSYFQRQVTKQNNLKCILTGCHFDLFCIDGKKKETSDFIVSYRFLEVFE